MKLLVFLALVAVSCASFAPLYKARDPIDGQYIVKVKNGKSIDSVIADLQILGSFNVQRRIYGMGLFSGTIAKRVLDLIRRSDAIEYVEEDGVYKIAAVASWGLDRIDQGDLPLDDTYTPIGRGSGVDVYVLDTGVNPTHVDYGGRATSVHDTVQTDGSILNDCNGHGSHCAGTVGGTTYGVANQVSLKGVRVLNCQGSGTNSGIVDACDWVATTATNNGADIAVASMSLGGGPSITSDAAVRRMVEAGIPVAVAAGNDDEDAANHSPAREPYAITVGSTQNDDYRSSFSNFGSLVDIFAPGTDITSCWYDTDTAVSTISGTSMATPHVAGALAIKRGLNGAATPQQLIDDLQACAIPNKISNKCPQSPDLLLYVGSDTSLGASKDSCRRDEGSPGMTLTHADASGSFQSHASYDGTTDYANYCDALVKFNAPKGLSTLTLKFTAFDVEQHWNCKYDYVNIYNGDKVEPDSRTHGKYCGANIPSDVVMTGVSQATIWMHSDYIYGGAGFAGTYSWS